MWLAPGASAGEATQDLYKSPFWLLLLAALTVGAEKSS